MSRGAASPRTASTPTRARCRRSRPCPRAGGFHRAQHLLADPDHAVGPVPVRAQPGHNSVAGFSVNQDDGSLTAIGRVATEAVPRAFSLDTTGNYLYASGLETGRLASYRVNQDSGELEPLEIYDIGREPMWVTIIDL